MDLDCVDDGKAFVKIGWPKFAPASKVVDNLESLMD